MNDTSNAERLSWSEAVHGCRPRRMGIDTCSEHVVYLHSDSPVCRAEGFEPHSRVEMRIGERTLLATLNVVYRNLLDVDEAGLSESAWCALVPTADDRIYFAHPPMVDSLAAIRSKVYGKVLTSEQIDAIIRDIVHYRYSNIELAAFITACAGSHLDASEVIALTGAMVKTGNRLHWDSPIVVDKHCIGGLAGNRTTPIVVAIVTALGLVMPKTSSRAITSPAGTANTMATMAPVDISIETMRHAVHTTGGCIAWGGAMGLSPADDILIGIESALDIDGENQMVASVLSKKISAGSTHVLLDIPVGPTAKVRDAAQAQSLIASMETVSKAFGLTLRTMLSDGTQPVGCGIGPALEAHDVLAVLRNHPQAPADLRARAIDVAANILEMAGVASNGPAHAIAADVLASGKAWTQFQAICNAQGGMREPGRAAHQRPVCAAIAGRVGAIDNRLLSRLAKLAGAPQAPTAGIELHAHLGDVVQAGQPLFVLHAESIGELDYAGQFSTSHPTIVHVEADE